MLKCFCCVSESLMFFRWAHVGCFNSVRDMNGQCQFYYRVFCRYLRVSVVWKTNILTNHDALSGSDSPKILIFQRRTRERPTELFGYIHFLCNTLLPDSWKRWTQLIGWTLSKNKEIFQPTPLVKMSKKITFCFEKFCSSPNEHIIFQ